MNIGLTFREFLTGAYQIVQEELDQLIAGIQGSWSVNHKTSGEHGSVTADSIRFNTQAAYTGTVFGDFQISAASRWLRGPWYLDVPGNDIQHTAMLRPQQITANQNDYAPYGHATAIGMDLTSDANRNITGITMLERQKRLMVIGNRGSNIISLINQSSSSTAAYRFALPGGIDYLLGPNHYIWLYYDPDSQRWRVIGQQHPVFVSASMSANQSIATATQTKIQFDTENLDSHGLYDPTTNYRFTAPTAGWYWITANLRWEPAGSVATVLQTSLAINGTVSSSHTSRDGTDGTEQVVSVIYSNLVNLAQSDYVEVYGQHTAGVNRNVGNASSWFTVFKLQA